MWHVSEKLGCRAQFFHFLAAYNWAAVIQNGLFMAMDVIFVSIGAPEGARGLFGLILLVYVLLYAWFVAQKRPGPASRARMPCRRIGYDGVCVVGNLLPTTCRQAA